MNSIYSFYVQIFRFSPDFDMILTWKICMTSFRLLEAESKDDCVEVKAALVRIYRHRSKELPARLIS